MANNNQNEKEFFALVTTGRKGVEDMFSAYGKEIAAVSAPNVRADFGTWSQRALLEVTTNDNLRSVISTKEGVHSVYAGLLKAGTLGLQIGGSFPHAYLVPKGNKAALIPSQDGYIFATTYGPGAILETPPTLHEVYEKDDCSIDDATATFKHNYAPFGDRGKLVGFFTELFFKDGRKVIAKIDMSEVRGIEDSYGQKNSPAYSKSPLDMHRKTAMKKMLKPYVKLCEGLAMLIATEEDAEIDLHAYREPDMRDVTERMADRLGTAAEAYTEESEPVTEPQELPKKPVDKTEKTLSQGEIF